MTKRPTEEPVDHPGFTGPMGPDATSVYIYRYIPAGMTFDSERELRARLDNVDLDGEPKARVVPRFPHRKPEAPF